MLVEIFFGKIFRALFMALDDAVYGLAEIVYRLFIKIAETGIFSPESIQTFAGRIYFFLGLAMLFKVSISIIDYIMNPDSIKDNKVGAGKLLKNIVIILIGIVTIPYIFQAAYSLQRIILRDNVIGNLILGVKYTDSSTEEDARSFTERAGDEMSFSIYKAFFHINEELVDSSCQNGAWEGENGTYRDGCWPSGESTTDLSMIKDKYIAAYNAKERKQLTKFNIMNATVKTKDGDEVFLFDYMYVVATLAGAFLCYILLVFCFDIAVRSVKLGFLQLIAPVPLISKIDPKKGDEVFNKWVKECVSTYALLFIRLVAIYFAIYIISSVTDTYNVVTEADEKNLFVNVFIIFGVLLFVKDLPKLIESLTGIKLDGNLNIAKKLRSVPLVGNAAAEGVALGGKTIGNLGRGIVSGVKNGNMKNSMNQAWKNIRDDASNMGHGLVSAGKQVLGANDRELDRLERAKGRLLKKNADKEAQIKAMKSLASDNDKIRERARKKVTESAVYAQRKMDVENLKNAAATAQTNGKLENESDADFESRVKNLYDKAATEEAKFNKWANKDAVNNYIDGSYEFAGRSDAELDRLVSDRDNHAETLLDGEYLSKFKGVSAQYVDDYLGGEFKNSINSIEHEIYSDQQEIQSLDEQIKQKQEDIKSAKPYYQAHR